MQPGFQTFPLSLESKLLPTSSPFTKRTGTHLLMSRVRNDSFRPLSTYSYVTYDLDFLLVQYLVQFLVPTHA